MKALAITQTTTTQLLIAIKKFWLKCVKWHMNVMFPVKEIGYPYFIHNLINNT